MIKIKSRVKIENWYSTGRNPRHLIPRTPMDTLQNAKKN